MLSLSNGYQFRFCCASGALGFDGESWWFEQPWRWFGILRPEAFTIITKTLTYSPRAGNLKMWCPWRCIRLLQGDTVVNSVGLTNPGYQWWLDKVYKKLRHNTIISVMPDSVEEAVTMAKDLNVATNLVGVEINVSCPNVCHDSGVKHVVDIVESFLRESRHPVILKLSHDQPYLEICKYLDGKVQAFDLINSVPWKLVFPNEPSPLRKYGLIGGVSGPLIAIFAREALIKVKGSDVVTPIISGGGIYSLAEAKNRLELGAEALSFGTIFIKYPWAANKIVQTLEKK